MKLDKRYTFPCLLLFFGLAATMTGIQDVGNAAEIKGDVSTPLGTRFEWTFIEVEGEGEEPDHETSTKFTIENATFERTVEGSLKNDEAIGISDFNFLEGGSSLKGKYWEVKEINISIETNPRNGLERINIDYSIQHFNAPGHAPGEVLTISGGGTVLGATREDLTRSFQFRPVPVREDHIDIDDGMDHDYDVLFARLDTTALASSIGTGALPKIGSWSFVADTRHVPEPLTLLGSTAALGAGVLLKRKYDKMKTKV